MVRLSRMKALLDRALSAGESHAIVALPLASETGTQRALAISDRAFDRVIVAGLEAATNKGL